MRADSERVCVAMGMLLHSNEHLQISTVADRLSMLSTCGKIPWEAPTLEYSVVCELLMVVGRDRSMCSENIFCLIKI
jgi:hypothetical protein